MMEWFSLCHLYNKVAEHLWAGIWYSGPIRVLSTLVYSKEL